MKTLVILTLGFLSLPAFGRLGETLEQLTARYGQAREVKPEDAGGKKGVVAFAKDGYLIWAELHQGQCERIGFRKEDKSMLSNNELTTWLKASGGERKWEATPEDKTGVSELRTTDGTLEAHINDPRTMLFINTKAWAERHRDSEAAAEKARLKGF